MEFKPHRKEEKKTVHNSSIRLRWPWPIMCATIAVSPHHRYISVWRYIIAMCCAAKAVFVMDICDDSRINYTEGVLCVCVGQLKLFFESKSCTTVRGLCLLFCLLLFSVGPVCVTRYRGRYKWQWRNCLFFSSLHLFYHFIYSFGSLLCVWRWRWQWQ